MYPHEINTRLSTLNMLDYTALPVPDAVYDDLDGNERMRLREIIKKYSGEKNLLELSPKYIKIDLSIIRGIDTDPDKQQIVANIVAYAHPRKMLIIAEGLETPEEIHKVLELDVDLLQGFCLARPAAIPGSVHSDALDVIYDFYHLQ